MERRVRVAEVCAKEGISENSFLYSLAHRLLYCRNAKVTMAPRAANLIYLTHLTRLNYLPFLTHLDHLTLGQVTHLTHLTHLNHTIS